MTYLVKKYQQIEAKLASFWKVINQAANKFRWKAKEITEQSLEALNNLLESFNSWAIILADEALPTGATELWQRSESHKRFRQIASIF